MKWRLMPKINLPARSLRAGRRTATTTFMKTYPLKWIACGLQSDDKPAHSVRAHFPDAQKQSHLIPTNNFYYIVKNYYLWWKQSNVWFVETGWMQKFPDLQNLQTGERLMGTTGYINVQINQQPKNKIQVKPATWGGLLFRFSQRAYSASARTPLHPPQNQMGW